MEKKLLLPGISCSVDGGDVHTFSDLPKETLCNTPQPMSIKLNLVISDSLNNIVNSSHIASYGLMNE